MAEDVGRIVVVGAGPVGLTAALLLARRGHGVLVLERRPEVSTLPRAVHLDDEALRVLQDAGVAAGFARVSRPMAGLRLLDADHRVLAEFARGRGPHGFPQASMFHQPDLEDLLRAAVAEQPRVELRVGVEVTAVRRTGRGAVVTVTDRSGSGSELAAAVVLGCDGAHSVVARSIGGRYDRLARPDRWCVVDLQAATPLDVWPGVHQVCDPVRPATFMPLAADRYRAEFRLRPDELVADLDLPARLSRFGAGGCTVVRTAEYTYGARVARRWRSGRVLLCGDAAHLTPPFIGQGLGLGLRDAHQLAWKVDAVLAGADDALLDSHRAERAAHARTLIRLAALLGWLMTAGGPRAVRLRRLVLRFVPRSLLATGSPALPRGPLVHRRRFGPAGPVGVLVPQPTLRDGRRLDDVLGPGWALLVCSTDPPVLPPLPGGVHPRVLHRGALPDLGPALRGRWVLVRPDRIVAAVGPRSRA